MDGNRGDDLNDRMREERLREERLRASGLDRSGVPDSNATSESLVADSMRTGAPRGDVVDVDRDAADLRRDDINPGDEIGEAVGGISGVLTGAALGSLGGPIGTIIGGIAGAVSGWWAGRAISEAASHATSDDDEYYRTHFDSAAGGRAARTYDDVRPAYQLGHIAGRNPDYQARSFDEVERDLRHGWSTDVSERHGPWDEVRDYARHAYERGRSTTSGTAGMAGNVGQRVGNALDDTKDRLDANPASRPGLDRTDSAYRATGAGPVDRAADTLGSAGHRTANALDDVKDRVDGNPASRPGYDRNDDPARAGMVGRDPLGHAGDRVEHAADRAENAVERAWDKTKDVAHRAGEKVENAFERTGDKLDDTKDRVDGNPASRPGVDRTDDPDRRF